MALRVWHSLSSLLVWVAVMKDLTYEVLFLRDDADYGNDSVILEF